MLNRHPYGIRKAGINLCWRAVLFVGLVGALRACESPPSSETAHPTMASLQTASEAWWQAWRTGDFDTVMAFEGEAIGFGYRTRTPRIIDDIEAVKQRRQRWFAGFERMRFDPITRSYDLHGKTGLEWGSYIEEQHRPDGSMMQRQGRYTMTYVWEEGRWRVALYHRSPLPDSTSN